MAAIFLDTSVIATILLQQPGWEACLALWNKHPKRYAANLVVAELLALAKRETLDVAAIHDVIDAIAIVHPDHTLLDELTAVFRQGHCRGADAYHVATALYLDPSADTLIFATRDTAQAKIAKGLGFSTL